jgi:O-antigen ligase
LADFVSGDRVLSNEQSLIFLAPVERKHLLWSLLLPLLFVFLFDFFSGKTAVIILLAILPVMGILLLDFPLMLSAIVASLFLNVHVYGHDASVWFTFLVYVGFLVTHRNLRRTDFAHSLWYPLLAYGATQILSLANSTTPLANLYLLYNYAAMILLIAIVVASVKSESLVRRLLVVFLLLTGLNSLQVVIQGVLVHKRVFGFGGIMFVDYVGMSVVVATVLAVFHSGMKRYAFIGLTILFAGALITTQTRTSWISTAVTSALFMSYLIIKAPMFHFRRTRLIVTAFSSVILVIGSYALMNAMNPSIGLRATETTDTSTNAINEGGRTTSSLVTRVLVWHTAYQAFQSHPIIGVGAYGFPMVSSQYYTIPKILYDAYVKDLTPHQTYVAVLAETGMVGLLGFGVLLVALVAVVSRLLSRYDGKARDKLRLAVVWSFCYCLVSMWTTDAWLYGRGIVLLSVLIGLMLMFDLQEGRLREEVEEQRSNS